jgi:glutamyl-tRNA reductase
VELRERLAFGADGLDDALQRMLQLDAVAEGLIVSTCNRVEVLVRVDAEARVGLDAVKNFLVAEREITQEELERHGYHHTGLEVVRHLFEVAIGLDSMILGEPQILGQVRQAYETARNARTTGPITDRLLQQCLATAKRIRNETGIARNAVSVAYAAVGLARQIFGDLNGRNALLLGAGKMSELVARHLVSTGVGHVWVASRTYNNAVLSASRFGGRPMHWADGLERLDEADVVVSCTGAPSPILPREQVAAAMRRRKGKPLFIIDIAVPRDVDPEVHGLDNVYLSSIAGASRWRSRRPSWSCGRRCRASEPGRSSGSGGASAGCRPTRNARSGSSLAPWSRRSFTIRSTT